MEVGTMTVSMTEPIAYEHGADLRREADNFRRVHGRADRAAPRMGHRSFAGLFTTHRRSAVVGCEA